MSEEPTEPEAQEEEPGAPSGSQTEEQDETKDESTPPAREISPEERRDSKVSSSPTPPMQSPHVSDLKVAKVAAGEVDKSNVSFLQKSAMDSGGFEKKVSKPSDLGLGKGTSSLRWSGSSRIPSKAKISSLISIKRASATSYGDRVKFIRYANSYKLESENPFNVDRVFQIVKTTLVEFLEDDMTYEAETCNNNAKIVSAKLRDAIKEEHYDRFKIISIVTVGEKKSQDMIAIIRFLWDSERDRFVHFFHENMYIFVAAAIFGVYFE